MIKGLLEKLPLTTILIAYFFICGGLYLIGFWTTFKIDITPFVSLTDIPKSFVLPFVLSQGLFLFHLLTNMLSTTLYKDNIPDETNQPTKPKRKIWLRILLATIHPDTLFSFAVAFIIFYSHDHRNETMYWYLSSMIVGAYLIYKFMTINYVKTKIPYFSLRLYAGYILCLLPIFCFSTGKILAVNIYNNKDIMYISKISDNNQSPNTDTNLSYLSTHSFKLIGFLGDKLVISSLTNDKIVFINQSTFSTVELSKEQTIQTVDSTVHATLTTIDSTTTQTNDTTVKK